MTFKGRDIFMGRSQGMTSWDDAKGWRDDFMGWQTKWRDDTFSVRNSEQSQKLWETLRKIDSLKVLTFNRKAIWTHKEIIYKLYNLWLLYLERNVFSTNTNPFQETNPTVRNSGTLGKQNKKTKAGVDGFSRDDPCHGMTMGYFSWDDSRVDVRVEICVSRDDGKGRDMGFKGWR